MDNTNLALDRFREYLMLLARMHLGAEIRHKIDPSDVVQQTLLEAHQQKDRFHGKTPAEMAGWLRKILACNLADALRTIHRAKRDPERELSLQAELDASSTRLEAWLVSRDTSPEDEAQKHEDLIRLAEALAHLPESQREALLLRHCHAWTLAQIGEHLGIAHQSVVGLLQRGVKQLQLTLDFKE